MVSYNTPPYDSTDWHIPLNENFTNIENDINSIISNQNIADFGTPDQPQYGAPNGRPIIDPYGIPDNKSQWSKEIYCAPASQGGSDTGAGTQNDPVTLYGAFKLLPVIQFGRIRIDLTTVPTLPATYLANEGGAVQLPTFIGGTTIAERVWDGDTTNPSNVVFDAGAGHGMTAFGKGEHHHLQGVELQELQINGTNCWVSDCNILTSPRSGSTSAVFGKNGIFRLDNCTIGTSGNPSPLYASGHCNVYLKGCDILSNDGTLFNAAPATIWNFGPGNSLNGTGVENLNDSAIVTAFQDADPPCRMIDGGGDMFIKEFGGVSALKGTSL